MSKSKGFKNNNIPPDNCARPMVTSPYVWRKLRHRLCDLKAATMPSTTRANIVNEYRKSKSHKTRQCRGNKLVRNCSTCCNLCFCLQNTLSTLCHGDNLNESGQERESSPVNLTLKMLNLPNARSMIALSQFYVEIQTFLCQQV